MWFICTTISKKALDYRVLAYSLNAVIQAGVTLQEYIRD